MRSSMILDTSGQCARILSHLRKISPDSVCIADLADYLDWDKSTVSARLNELKHGGKIDYAGKMPSAKTGIKSMHWRILTEETLF